MDLVQRILVPTDFSPGAQKALEYAADLALKYRASIDVVHVLQPEVRLDARGGSRGFKQGEITAVELRRSAIEQLNRVLAELKDFGVKHCRGRLFPGRPSPAILEMAQSGDYHLIVMTTHGGSSLADVLIGSCTERVVRRSPVPVLVIPSPRDLMEKDVWEDGEVEELSGWVRGSEMPAAGAC